jgi:tetratricopeptide (TPR) repeat protein
VQTTFPILIHAGFYKVLRESPSAWRSRVQKTLVRLRQGHWDGGTRVKRLAGVSQAVFEARVDAGDRLLFTAVRAASREDPDRLTTHLQIWDVVHHDRVSRRARRNLVPEAEFLDYESLEEFDIVEPPPHPATLFDEIAADGAEPLLQFLIPPDGFESPTAEGINGGIRWYLVPDFMLADEAEFQRMIDRSEGELELKLMRDQYEILRAPGPLLLAGSAGSGKTTIAIHRLVEARSQMETGRLLYLSYSPWLVDYARRLYRDISISRGRDPNATPPQFLTFTDLYCRLIRTRDSTFTADVVTRDAFTAWLRRGWPQADAALVWEEVRSILKGACLNLGRAMLDERQYYDLGRKRAPLFVNERPEIFRIAERYQQWLASAGRSDQIDLCRSAFRQSRHGHGGKYDVIVCDEVQDLTELEVAFVLSLSAHSTFNGVMLAGDTQQIVNPTGFRWAEVRQAIAKATGTRTAPKPAQLRRNCRSVRPLVELANSVLSLKQDIFGRYEEDGLEDAVVEGPMPIQVVEEEKRVLETARNFGPRCAILVLDEAESLSLSRLLDTTRVFHVRDAKGLEFDTVILWKLLQSENGLIDRFLRGAAGIERDARFRHFLQYLYVAVTRARRNLAIFEGDKAHPFWNNARFRGRLEIETADALRRLFRDSASPDEWAKEAEYYLERMRYRQAAECFRRAGLSDRESEALAMFAETMEDWPQALAIWQRLGKLERQGFLLEKLGRASEAIELYLKLGRKADAERLELSILEKQGRWAEAAKRWEQMGCAADAVRCYQRAGNNARALTLEATHAETGKDWKRAAECWLSLKSYERAAQCFRKAHDRRNAALAVALHYEGLHAWTKAATAYQRAGERAKAAECRAQSLEAAGQLLKAAKLRERLGQKDRALQLYKRAGDQEAVDRFSVERADLRQSQTANVTALCARGSYRLAIQLAERRRAVIKKRLDSFTWPYSERSDNQMYDELDDLQDLIVRAKALLAEKSNAWLKASRFWQRIQEYDRAEAAESKAIESLKDPVQRGFALIQTGRYDKGLEILEATGDAQTVACARATIHELRREWQAAADLWKSVGNTVGHARAMAELARASENWEEAASWHHIAGEPTRAAQATRAARARSAAEARKIRRAHASLF